jgi:DNA-binding NarL/FixJ family response regulator
MRRADGELIEVVCQAFVHTEPGGGSFFVDVIRPAATSLSGRATEAQRADVVAGYALTPREVCLLQLMVEAVSDEDMAVLLSMSVKDLQAAVGALIRKMKASSRTEACVLAMKNRLVS